MKRFAIAAAIAATIACQSCRSKKQAESYTLMNDSAAYSKTAVATGRCLDAIHIADDEDRSTAHIHFNDSGGRITVHADGTLDITNIAEAGHSHAATHTSCTSARVSSDSVAATVRDRQTTHTSTLSYCKEEKSRGIPWETVAAAAVAATALAIIVLTIYYSRPKS